MMTSASASPVLLGVPVASLAFAVSLLSFSVALAALGWQIAKHRLDGGRPKVYLNAALWEPHSKIFVNRSGKWELGSKGALDARRENIELAQLVVENPGRTAITVYSPGLAIEGTEKSDYSISPRRFELRSYGADRSTMETSVRLDPYDRVTFLLDYWSIVPQLLDEANGESIELRGCISVAGRNKLHKSNKRLAWKIRPDAWTARTDIQEIDPFTVIWRELFKANVRNHSIDKEEDGFPGFSLGVAVRTAMGKFSERPSAKDFVEALRQAHREDEMRENTLTGFAVLSLSMDESLDRHKGHLSAWNA
ncbi:hypothetical protein [Streptomyces griseus]|uniref:hypothetical protein n=1 Tax=Streptomyces griseus TaxID=1911 RepID=UPI0033A98B9E